MKFNNVENMNISTSTSISQYDRVFRLIFYDWVSKMRAVGNAIF